MKAVIKVFFKKYFEIAAFSMGLLLLAFMDPYSATGPSLCLIDNLGFEYCPGDGLGHSVAYIFRGELSNALEANILGPFAIIILSGRIFYLFYNNLFNRNKISE